MFPPQLMNQARIQLEEENIRLQDKLFILMSKCGINKQDLLQLEAAATSECCGDDQSYDGCCENRLVLKDVAESESHHMVIEEMKEESL
jgi:hypothetical protein